MTEMQTLPFGWKVLEDIMLKHFSPLECESYLLKEDFSRCREIEEWSFYKDFLAQSFRILFDRFGLHWSFSEYSISSAGPGKIIPDIVRSGALLPWIQKNALCQKFYAQTDAHWLQYCQSLDPLFSIHPHPLLSLLRSIIISPREHH
jgi:hypothetical protein